VVIPACKTQFSAKNTVLTNIEMEVVIQSHWRFFTDKLLDKIALHTSLDIHCFHVIESVNDLWFNPSILFVVLV